MRIEKVINNNIISSHDDGVEIIAMGRGIGFGKKAGCEIDDARIEKTFRMENKEVMERFKNLLAHLPLVHIQISDAIISMAKAELKTKLNQNIYITLTDHINFAIEREMLGMGFSNALMSEVKMFYPKEYEIGWRSLKLIADVTGRKLPPDEAASIALHLVSAQYNSKIHETWKITQMMQGILEIIRKYFSFAEGETKEEKEDFIMHIKYLARRIFADEQYEQYSDEDDSLYQYVKKLYQLEYDICWEIAGYISKEFGYTLCMEEKTYLILKLKRLAAKQYKRNYDSIVKGGENIV